ncbi:MAG TPA: 50S ribosomal protein L24 [Alphaproteobacteria bacterium]|nr:50S ribosomal protein L24 [Alphaproteobacteria bacterium]
MSASRTVDAVNKYRKGDKVVVVTGRDKGKKGEILKVLRKENRAVVSGVNMVKRHTAPSMQGPGGIIEKEAPLHLSNIALQDPKDGKATKVSFSFLKDGRKVRVARRSGEVIDV